MSADTAHLPLGPSGWRGRWVTPTPLPLTVNLRGEPDHVALAHGPEGWLLTCLSTAATRYDDVGNWLDGRVNLTVRQVETVDELLDPASTRNAMQEAVDLSHAGVRMPEDRQHEGGERPGPDVRDSV